MLGDTDRGTGAAETENSPGRTPAQNADSTRSRVSDAIVNYDLLDALDLPDHLQPIQDAYFQAKREWEAVREGYAVAITDAIARSYV